MSHLTIIGTNHVHVENATYRWRYNTGWGNTFASFTLVYGLHLYFKEKLQADPQMLANKRRRPPLDYVLRQRRRASCQIRHSEPGSRRTSPNSRSKSESGFSAMYSLEPFPDLLYTHQNEIKKLQSIELCSEAVHLLIRHEAKAGLQDFEKPGNGGGWCRGNFCPLPLKILQEVFEESEFQTMKDMLRVKPPPNDSRGHRFINYIPRFFTQTHQDISCDDR